MIVLTYPANIEEGKFSLPEGVKVPASARIFILVVTDDEARPVVHMRSPRLAHPEQAKDFVKTFTREEDDA